MDHEFKVENLSSCSEIGEVKDLGEQVLYVNNLPLNFNVRLCRNKETEQIELDMYLTSKCINQVTLAELVFHYIY